MAIFNYFSTTSTFILFFYSINMVSSVAMTVKFVKFFNIVFRAWVLCLESIGGLGYSWRRNYSYFQLEDVFESRGVE